MSEVKKGENLKELVEMFYSVVESYKEILTDYINLLEGDSECPKALLGYANLLWDASELLKKIEKEGY